MNILVTGGAGFMGSYIVDELVKRNHQVYVVDNLSGSTIEYLNPKAIFYKLDLAQQPELLMSNIRPEVIFYLAASAREGASQFDPVKITQTNYWAYVKTLENAIKFNVKKVILFSSMAVYGNQQVPFSEDLPPHPVDIYGINKSAMEETTKILADVHGFKWTIIRPHNVAGIRQCLTDKYRNVIAIFMNRIMREEPIYIYGDGKQQRAFSYIGDSLPCYMECMESGDREIFNIGGRNPITINALAELVINCFPEYKHPEIIHLADRPCEVKDAWCTTKKSEEILGYRERVKIEDWVKNMAEWAKQVGSQKWTEDTLALKSDKMPKIWI